MGDDEHDPLVRFLTSDPDVPMVAEGERYVVVYAVSYDHDDNPSRSGEEVRTPRDAAHYALELTRDKGAFETQWRVYDAVTKKWSTFDQSEIDRQ
jgi:hypothetical protein